MTEILTTENYILHKQHSTFLLRGAYGRVLVRLNVVLSSEQNGCNGVCTAV